MRWRVDIASTAPLYPPWEDQRPRGPQRARSRRATPGIRGRQRHRHGRGCSTPESATTPKSW